MLVKLKVTFVYKNNPLITKRDNGFHLRLSYLSDPLFNTFSGHLYFCVYASVVLKLYLLIYTIGLILLESSNVTDLMTWIRLIWLRTVTRGGAL
jgi:hypothetical protein